MRTVTRATLIVFIALLLNNPCLYPVIIPHLDLPTLVKDATYILVAEVLARNITGRDKMIKHPRDPNISIPATELVADVRVVRIFKGDLPTKSIQICFYLPHSFMGYSGIPSGQKGLLFLRKREDGKYALIDPYHPMLVAGRLAAKSDASILDQVLDVMALAVLDPELSTSDRRAASASLDQVDSPNLVEILHNRIKQADFVGQVLISKILIKRGEYWWLEKLNEILVKTPDKIHLYERGDIATAIIYGITNPKAVPCLAQLIKAPDSFLRRAAVMTLRQINSEAAIPTFIIALNDDVQDVRFYGVTGLATVTRQDEYNPGVALYKENENYYLSYWRDWAKKREK